MSERGQRITLRLGHSVEAEVSLVKMASAPRDAKHEVRRIDAKTGEVVQPLKPRRLQKSVDSVAEEMPFHTGTVVSAKPDFSPVAVSETRPVELPETIVQQGVTTETGEWIDLTDVLAAIDERCILDGMELVATPHDAAVPKAWVRDSSYIVPAGDGALKVLHLLWAGLRRQNRVAVVRWTKRTNQACGVIAARGTGPSAHLELLELEWEANIRPVPSRALLDVAKDAVTEDEVKAVIAFVEAYAAPAAVFEGVRDERSAQRAELLEAARQGVGWSAPAIPDAPGEADDLVVALTRGTDAA